jgi:putative tricarboxylic transport membrane protein
MHRVGVFSIPGRAAHGKTLLARAAAMSPGDLPLEVNVKTQKSADITAGCLVALIGIFILYAATMISEGGVHRLSPRTFPYVIGCLLFLCGAGLALKTWSLQGEGPTIAWPDGEGVRAILVNLISLAVYIALMDPLGLPLSTFLYLAFTIWYLNRSKWVMAVTVGLITGGISYVLFIRVLGLSFPAGFLFE